MIVYGIASCARDYTIHCPTSQSSVSNFVQRYMMHTRVVHNAVRLRNYSILYIDVVQDIVETAIVYTGLLSIDGLGTVVVSTARRVGTCICTWYCDKMHMSVDGSKSWLPTCM